MSDDNIGFDYGLGQKHTDHATGIRYGVIPQNDVHPDALDVIMTQGEDVAFKAARQECQDRIINAIDEYWSEFVEVTGLALEKLEKVVSEAAAYSIHRSVAERIAGEVRDDAEGNPDKEDIATSVESALDNHFGDGYESDNGLADYVYEREGYKVTGDSHGDLWVLKSRFYTYAQFCSPCAPGAGYLTEPRAPDSGAPMVYCLGFDWFDNLNAPYRIWRVADNMEMVVREMDVRCENCGGTGRDTVRRLAQVRGESTADIEDQILSGVIKVEEFQHFNHNFKCWRCAGRGYTTEREEIEKTEQIQPSPDPGPGSLD